MKQDDDTDKEIGDDESEDTRESTLSLDIEVYTLNHQQKVILLGQACWDKSLWTARVPLPKKWSTANTVIVCPPHPNSRNPAGAMAAPLQKH